MAETSEQQLDVEYKGMPGADTVSKEEAEPFQVDLNFDEPEAPEAEVEFPAVEEAVEEVAEAVVEEVVDEPVNEDTGEVEVSEEVEAAASTTDGATEQEAAEVTEEAVVEEPEPPKSPMVPKSRLDEVLAKNKKMQKQLEDIQQKEAEAQAEAPKYDFEAKEVEYQEAILDGDSAKAASIRQDIRSAEREQTMFEVKQEMGQSIQFSQAEQDLAVKAQEIEQTFAVLNENSESFDRDLAGEVRDLRDAFMTQGFTPADSLAKATEYTLAAKHPEMLQGAPGKKAQQNKAVAEKRQKTTVQKKLAASKSQPPSMKGEGTAKRGDIVPDVNVLSDDEFAALPEETLRRIRGDFG